MVFRMHWLSNPLGSVELQLHPCKCMPRQTANSFSSALPVYQLYIQYNKPLHVFHKVHFLCHKHLDTHKGNQKPNASYLVHFFSSIYEKVIKQQWSKKDAYDGQLCIKADMQLRREGTHIRV